MSNHTYRGSCYCHAIRWKVSLDNPASQARTSLCHCENCKSFFGTAYGITTRIPTTSFSYSPENSVEPTTHTTKGPNGEVTLTTRQFCGKCGSPIREWGAAAEEKGQMYVCYGGFDAVGRKDMLPTAEFFTGKREAWCPDILGEDVFRKE